MVDYPSQENIQELNEIRNLIPILESEWQETLDDWVKMKDQTKSKELFTTIDYLTFCDQVCKNIIIDLVTLDSQLTYLSEMRDRFPQNNEHLNMIENLIIQIQDLKNQQEKKIQTLYEEYSLLAETILRKSEDVINQYIGNMQKEKADSLLRSELNQDLERELFLQELKDSLESYREAREDLISELTMGSPFQKLPEGILSEDLGEEKPEIDTILSQLDTLITSCDIALLIREIQD